jgi:SpoIID/LytB domain protein
VREVIEETWGEVLTYDGKICDARFSKCCGGVFEEFPYCWEDKDMPYLRKQLDNKSGVPIPDLTIEENAREWIYSSPEAFCNTTDRRILSQVLNTYDQETLNFFRWKEKYSQKELSDLIKSRSGVDYGEILDLIPIARGTSGRLWKLKIVGSKRSRTIGKELEIRRTLSPSHLYSSAFVVEKEGVTASGAPVSFTLIGAGWGHGVGLCQIGAAVMGDLGYDYREILLHYFNGSSVDKQY